MPAYEYDDFEIRFSPGVGGQYSVHAMSSSFERLSVDTTFRLPFGETELTDAIRTLGRTRSATREIDLAVPERKVTAERLGGELAGSLLSGEIGELYAKSRQQATDTGRGVRLRLTFDGTPELLNVPWEFLYLKPTFLASQRRWPIVRFLHTDAPIPPRMIDNEVRMLGVIANPAGPAPLDVNAEVQRVELATKKVRESGRLELDWLKAATRKSLRETLRDGQYHVVHFVGHSDYTDDGGAIFLENEAGQPDPLTDSQLVNLVGDQDRLRLVVLNSCEGARASTIDPYAGIATSLVALGVPAVIAMQFEITDLAAITFAEELYLSLIARQEPVDAAVANARLAMFTEVNETEFATPVLFLRNTNGQIFNFARDAATGMEAQRTGPVPLLPPPDGEPDRTIEAPPDDVDGEDSGQRAHPPSKWPKIAAFGGAIGGLLLIAVLIVIFRPWSDDATSTTTSPSTTDSQSTAPRTSGPVTYPTVPGTQRAEWIGPRPKSNLIAVAAMETDGGTNLSHLSASGSGGNATNAENVDDVDPFWDPSRNVLVFSRHTSATTADIRYVVPGNGNRPDGQPDQGIQVRQLGLGRANTDFDHAPVWRKDGNLVFARAHGCAPGPGCAEEILLATIERDGDFVKSATVDPTPLSDGWTQISAVSVDPSSNDRLAISGRGSDGRMGVYLVTGPSTVFLAGSERSVSATFNADGSTIVAIEQGSEPGWGTALLVWPASAGPNDQPRRVEADSMRAGNQVSSIAVSPNGDGRYAVLLDERGVLNNELPVIAVLDANFEVVGQQKARMPQTGNHEPWVDFVDLAW
jgi:hypothetical protein